MFPGAIDVLPATYLDQLGTIFTRLPLQDSGNLSYDVQTATARYFVKTAGDTTEDLPAALDTYFPARRLTVDSHCDRGASCCGLSTRVVGSPPV
ncbi:hypothetical protein [Kribbella solani]|uniref:hypothetical protein n=1 Tax=Kribbella solani TaxID=236067 RepID=UPI0029A170E1|nr:hypothetical protein [Kribbella solani]MDX2974046.1 hypothetical protein [Kribbella solani]